MNNDWLDKILLGANQAYTEAHSKVQLELGVKPDHERFIEFAMQMQGKLLDNYKQQILDWHEKECEKRVLEAKINTARQIIGSKDGRVEGLARVCAGERLKIETNIKLWEGQSKELSE